MGDDAGESPRDTGASGDDPDTDGGDDPDRVASADSDAPAEPDSGDADAAESTDSDAADDDTDTTDADTSDAADTADDTAEDDSTDSDRDDGDADDGDADTADDVDTADADSTDEPEDDTADGDADTADDEVPDGEPVTIREPPATPELAGRDDQETDDDGDTGADDADDPTAGRDASDDALTPETLGDLEDATRERAADTTAAATDALPGLSAEGPPSDEEMPLAAHVEEMVKRLGVVFVIAALATVVVFPFGEELISFLWDSVLVNSTARPHLYSPTELLFTQVKVASLGGLVVALPVLVYESYLFMRPGLYDNERRYFLAAVPTSLVLAVVGIVFAYFVVLPAIFSYFLHYSEETAIVAFGLAPTFNLILVLMGYLAVVFQIPLLLMLAMMMGLVTREWLAGRRLLFWGAFAGISFFFSPDPTGVSPLIIAATMIALFEGTLVLARWTKSGE